MKPKFIFIVLAVIELLFLKQWFTCVKFASQFYFSAFDLKLRLIEAIHNDGDVPLFIVRLFHNKILGTFLDVYNNYVSYWEITFIIQLLSFVGAFGLFCCIWYLFREKRNRWMLILFAIALFMPFVEIFAILHVSFVFRLALIVIPLFAMSFLGWREFLESEERFKYWLFILLMILSLIWLLNISIQPLSIACLK